MEVHEMNKPLKKNHELGEVEKPSLFLFITELPRAIGAFFNGYSYSRKISQERILKPNPVIVLPGFMGSDLSTSLLRKYLKRKGYKTYGWGLGRNLANIRDLKKISELITDITESHQQPAIIIGWSLGGVYARHLTKHHSEKVAHLITMGSPYMGVSKPNRAHLTFKLVKWGRSFNEFERKWIESLPQPVKVPSVAIYSKKDGIVSWKVCHEIHQNESHQNIEVSCGHFGMGVSKEVFVAIDQVLEGRSYD